MATRRKTRSAKRRQRRRTLTTILIILLLLLMTLLGGLLYYLVVYLPEQNAVVGGKREAAALQGTLQVLTEEEIQAELNRVVEEGMFRISIASTIVGIEDETVDIRIENNRTNRYLMQVSLTLDETGEEIFATDLIDPGYYIKETRLDKPIKPGEYPATAIFTALYPDTGEIVGTAGAQVKLLILPKGATPTPSPTATPSPTPAPVLTATPEPGAQQ